MRDYFLLLFLFVLMVPGRAQGPEFQWGLAIGDKFSDTVIEIEEDPEGNLIILGTFKGSLSLELETQSVVLKSLGKADLFLAKATPEGRLIWARSLGSAKEDVAGDMAVGPDGAIYITGNFQGVMDFDPGSGKKNSLKSSYSKGYLMAMDGTGAFQWVNILDPLSKKGEVVCCNLQVTSSSRICLLGTYRKNLYLKSGGDVWQLETEREGNQLFLARFNKKGYAIILKEWESWHVDSPHMTLVGANQLAIEAHFTQWADMDPGTVSHKVVETVDGAFFMGLYNLSGDYLWGMASQGDGGITLEELRAGNQGEIYLAGHYHGDLCFSNDDGTHRKMESCDDSNVFVGCYSNEGELKSLSRHGGLGLDGVCGMGVGDDHLYLLCHNKKVTTKGGTQIPNGALLMAFHTDCSLDWSCRLGETNAFSGMDLFMGKDEKLFVGGQLFHSGAFLLEEPTSFFTPPGSRGDALVASIKVLPDVSTGVTPEREEEGMQVCLAQGGILEVRLLPHLAGNGTLAIYNSQGQQVALAVNPQEISRFVVSRTSTFLVASYYNGQEKMAKKVVVVK